MDLDLEAELDRLYRTPANAFVAERNQLARSLKQAERAGDAEVVAKLPRPSPVAWAINQVHFEAREALDALDEAGVALRRGQESVSGDFARLTRAHQQALRVAADRALELAERSGTKPSATFRRRVELTLTLLSASEETERARPGRLSVELEPVGFDAFSDVAIAEPRAPSPGRKTADDIKREAKLVEARVALDAAVKELARLEEAARRSQLRLERTQREAEDAERAVATTRRARDEATRDADSAAKEVEQARGDIERARRELGEP